jgi:poly(hydroxyalkanoate) granule-associated protein
MSDKKFTFDPNHLSDQMKESAQQIWLAGLGAFAKNQEEGKKMFDKLVDDGLSLQKKTQSTLNAKVHEATDKISEMASSLSKQAPNTWAPLEDIFQNRVAKANEKLGIPSQEAFEALSERVAQLEQLLKRETSSKDVVKPTTKAKTKSTPSTTKAKNS